MNPLIPWKRDDSRELQSVSRMRSDWDRLFDRVLDDVWAPAGRTGERSVPLELTETAEEIRIRAEVPGVDPQDLDISVTGDVLTLSGEKREERESKEGSSHYTERRYGSFRRTVQLGSPVDLDRVEARHEHGVVTITLQKAETVRPRRIEVQAG